MDAKSKSMPFMEAQPLLDGSLAGDVGFDPLGLSNINGVGLDLYWMREAELKHRFESAWSQTRVMSV